MPSGVIADIGEDVARSVLWMSVCRCGHDKQSNAACNDYNGVENDLYRKGKLAGVSFFGGDESCRLREVQWSRRDLELIDSTNICLSHLLHPVG